MVAEDVALGDVWGQVRKHGEELVRHTVEIAALKESTARLEALVAEVRGEVRETRSELRGEMGRGFDRLEAAVGKVTDAALQAYTPEAAQQLADTRASEAKARASGANAWAIAILLGATTLVAIIWPALHL